MNCSMQDSCQAVLRQSSNYVRNIFRGNNQQFFKIEQQRMQENKFQDALRERMWKIEGINAEAKNLHGLKRAKYRGLQKVQIQAHMVGVVLNIKRLVAFFDMLLPTIIASISFKTEYCVVT